MISDNSFVPFFVLNIGDIANEQADTNYFAF